MEKVGCYDIVINNLDPFDHPYHLRELFVLPVHASYILVPMIDTLFLVFIYICFHIKMYRWC